MPRATACSSSTMRMVAATRAMLHRCRGIRPASSASRASWYPTRAVSGRLATSGPAGEPQPDPIDTNRPHRGPTPCPPPARPLAAEHREVTGKAVKPPAPGRPPARPSCTATARPRRNVTVDAHEFEQLRRHTGPNALVDLSVDGKKAQPVLVHGVQVHPVNRRPLHVDLFLVRMTEELTVDVPLVATGESPAVDAARRHAPAPDRDGQGPGAARPPAAVDRVLRSSRSSTSTARSTSAT